MTETIKPKFDKDIANVADHIGKKLVEFIPMACHKAVWTTLYDIIEKNEWKLKEKKSE